MTHHQKNTQRFPRRSTSQWKVIIKRWEQSTLSVDEFCQKESIGLVAFKKWRTHYSPSRNTVKKSSIPDFLEMDNPINPSPGILANKPNTQTHHLSWDIELDFGAGIVCRIKGSMPMPVS